MSARSDKRRKSKSGGSSLARLKQGMTMQRLVIAAAGCGAVLGLTAYFVWSNGASEQSEITAEQLNRDFQEINLGALGIPESVPLSQPDHDSNRDEFAPVAWTPPVDNSDLALAHAETDPADASHAPAVIYAEGTASTGPLFPNPLSVPSGPSIQPTGYSGSNPAAPSSPAWLTGGIEFDEGQ